MFKRKLKALEFHSLDQNLEEEKNFRNLVCWLEDQKINHYKSEERKALRNTSAGDWEEVFQKYATDLNCPYPTSDRTLTTHWILSHAIRLEYQRKASKVTTPQQKTAADNPLDSMDFASADFKAGVEGIANTLQMPLHHDPAVVLKAISMIIKNNLMKNTADTQSKAKTLPSVPLNEIELGFETKDLISADAGRILRLCYLRDLRELQDVANQAIVACQSITANPKTDTKLGKAVARMETLHLKEGLRQRSKSSQRRWEPPKGTWDPDVPYGGKVYIARRKKPDTWLVLFIEALAILAAVGLAYYAYFHYERLHYHVARGYATFGFPEAQHVLGDKFYHGHGVEKDRHKAMEFYKLASDQGHPHSQYNLAVGHLKGVRTDLLQQGEAHKLIKEAAAKGVREAVRVLNEYCVHGRCDE